MPIRESLDRTIGASDHQLCGWRVRSALPLPELAEWQGGDREPDVEISIGAVAPQLDVRECVAAHDRHGRARLDVAPDGVALLAVEDVARFLVVQGRRVTIEPMTNDWAAVRVFLFGTVLAVLCYHRRLLPFHASCLVIDGVAVAVAGQSGAGKSTLAMTLAQQGIPVVADDICAVDPFAAAGPTVWPSIGRLKLWRDSLERLGMTVDPARRIRNGIDKYATSDAMFVGTPMPLGALYHLTNQPSVPDTTVRPLIGVDAVHAINQMLYKGHLGRVTGRDAWMDRAVMAILARVPAFAMARDPERDTPASLAARFLAHIGAERLPA